jgi:hypothetical protein
MIATRDKGRCHYNVIHVAHSARSINHLMAFLLRRVFQSVCMTMSKKYYKKRVTCDSQLWSSRLQKKKHLRVRVLCNRLLHLAPLTRTPGRQQAIKPDPGRVKMFDLSIFFYYSLSEGERKAAKRFEVEAMRSKPLGNVFFLPVSRHGKTVSR